MKRATRIGGAVGVGIALVLGGILFAIDGIARTGIQKGASYALGVPVDVGWVYVGLLSGNFSMRRLRIANPPGFESDTLLALGRAHFDVTPATLRQEIIRVPLFRLDRVEVALERVGGRTNTSAVLANLERFESSGKKAPESGSGGKKFIIEQMLIRDVTASIDVVDPVTGKIEVEDVEVVIPEIRLEKLGAEGRGLTFAELSDIVFKAVLSNIARFGTNLPGAVVGELRSGLGALASVPTRVGGDVVRRAGGEVVSGVSDTARAGGDTVRKTGEAIGGGAKKALGKVFGGDD